MSANFVLLRGLSREQRHWGAFRQILGERIPGARIFGLDLAGSGTEFARTSPTSLPEIVEDLRARWLALRDQNPGPWFLVGMSLGGMAVMQWGAAHPEDFAGVVLVNTSAANLSKPWNRMDLSVVPSVLRALVTIDPVKRERIILGMTTRVRKDLDPVAREWASYQADRPMTRVNVLRQLWAASRFPAPARLTVPTLILGGAHDPLANPSCARKLAAHFGAPLEVHPEAGHELALDAPEWFAEQVARFSSSLVPAPRMSA